MNVEMLYQQYGPMVLRRCRRMLGTEEEAVEAMQDVFVQILKRGNLEVNSPSSFLYKAATNVCLNKLRSKKRKPSDADSPLLERIATAPEAEDQSITKQALDWLFAREPESTRTMAVLHLVDGWTLEEVANKTGMSVSGVRKRLRNLKAHVPELHALDQAGATA